MKALIVFVIAIVNNSGQMEMQGYYVEKCPDKAEFSQHMNDLMQKGELKDWHAVCIDPPKPGQDT